MQIGRIPGFNAYQQQNQYFQNANRTLDARAAQRQEKQGDAARTDTAVFNYRPQRAQGNSMLQSLMEQKERLMEQKRSLMKEAKSGGVSVKEQMDQLNAQLEQLEEQIGQQMLADLTRVNRNDVQETEDEELKTEDEAEAEHIGQLTKMSADMATAQVVSVVQRKAVSEAQILQSEMSQDSMVGADGATMAELDAAIEAMRAREAAAAGKAEGPKAEASQPEVPKAEASQPGIPNAETAQADAPKAETLETGVEQSAKSPGAAAKTAEPTSAEAAGAAPAAETEAGTEAAVRGRHTNLSDSTLAKSDSRPGRLAELEGRAARLAGMVGGKLWDVVEEDDEKDPPAEKKPETEDGGAAVDAQ